MYKFEMDKDAIRVIILGLGELPAKISGELIQQIIREVKKQDSEREQSDRPPQQQ